MARIEPQRHRNKKFLIKCAIFKYVFFNANSSEYLFKVTYNRRGEGVGKFSVIVALCVIRKCMCI